VPSITFNFHRNLNNNFISRATKSDCYANVTNAYISAILVNILKCWGHRSAVMALLGCLDHSLSENSVNFKAVIMSWQFMLSRTLHHAHPLF
jgi:hypothetical protein